MLVMGALFMLGVGLLSISTRPGIDTAERQIAVQALAPAGQTAAENTAKPGAVTVPRSETQTITSFATTVNMADVVIDTSSTEDSMYHRYLRGEIDNEFDTDISEAEYQALISQALERPIDGDDVQRAPAEGFSPTIGFGFDSLDYTESGLWVPPDPDMAVGLNHIVATVNVAVEMYDKAGNTVFGPTSARNLFSNSPCTSGLFDPNVVYDEEENRWFIGYAQGVRSQTGGYCLLASQSGDPTGLWNEYFFPFNDSTGWLDYPHAGVGDEYIFVNANYFGYPGGFRGAKIHAFKKDDLYAGNPVTAVNRNLGFSYATVQPLNLHGESTGTWPAFGSEHYFMAGNGFITNTFSLLKWDVETDDFYDLNDLPWGGGSIVNTQQAGSGGSIRANDNRPLDFEYRNGFGWTTMTVGCNPGGGTVNCIRWGQIDLATADFGPEEGGVYSNSGDYMTFPDLAVNHCNSMALGYTNSDINSFPSVYVTGRRSIDTPSTLQPQVLVKAGEVSYNSFQSPPHRWGDYTSMTIDPDGYTFWYMGEYSKDTPYNTDWGTWINSFTYETSGCTVPADLTVNKSVSPTAPVSIGDTIEYTITVENEGRGFGDTNVYDEIPSELDNVTCVQREGVCPDPADITQIGTVTFGCTNDEVVASGNGGSSGGRPGTITCYGMFNGFGGTNDQIAFIDLAGLTWTPLGNSLASELQAFIDCPGGGTSDYTTSIGGAPATNNGNAPFTAGTATNSGCVGESPTGNWAISFNESYGDNLPNPDSELTFPIRLAVYGGNVTDVCVDTPVSTTLDETIAIDPYDSATYVCTGVVSPRVCNGQTSAELVNKAYISAPQDPVGTIISNWVYTTVDMTNTTQCVPLSIDLAEQAHAEPIVSVVSIAIILAGIMGLGLTVFAVRKRT